MLRTFLDKLFQSVQRYWQLYLLGVFALFFLMRLHWSFRVLAATVFLLAALVAIVGAFISIFDRLTSDGSEPLFLRRIAERADAARTRITELRAEARTIEKKINELQRFSSEGANGSGKQWGKSLLLLEGYTAELSLRKAKTDFYSRSLMTLNDLDNKWRQERRLNELQSGLEKLRSPNSVGERNQMLALRAELSKEQDLLKSYKQLSKRLDKSDSLENTKQLRKELERLLN